MKARGVFETVLYADDLLAAERFYRDVLGLEVISHMDAGIVFRCGGGALLLFDRHAARRTDRGVPAHGCDGAGHIAFALPDADYDAWIARFRACGVPIEMEKRWPAGGRSIYVRDPAGNSVELAPSTLWGGGWGF